MRTVLTISFSDLGRDPRLNRQIRALKRRYTVIAAGAADPQIDGVRFVLGRMPPRSFIRKLSDAAHLMAGQYDRYYWHMRHVAQLRRALDDVQADVVIANDVDALPLAFEAAKGVPVILDAHEYAPGEFGGLKWRLARHGYVRHLCCTYIRRTAGMMTVADGIASEYAKTFGIAPVVVQNAAPYAELRPTPVSPGVVRMIHHGNAVPGRRIEMMLDVMRLLPQRFRLDLMLLPSVPRYLAKLKSRAARDARIRFLPTVPMRELVTAANDYDVGLYLLPPASFNDLHALPNKFFEFVQSRLAIAIGPSPEMAALVKHHGLGVVAESFEPRALARELERLDAPQIQAMKQRSHDAAKALSFERDEEKMIALVERVASRA